jgi:hypothetical protein
MIKHLFNMAKNDGFFKRLLDLDDKGVSSTNLYMFLVTGIGFILLLVPAIILLIEAFYNHTISTNLDGMASYIGAVAALFASAGITKAWTSWTYSRYPQNECCPDEGKENDNAKFKEQEP